MRKHLLIIALLIIPLLVISQHTLVLKDSSIIHCTITSMDSLNINYDKIKNDELIHASINKDKVKTVYYYYFHPEPEKPKYKHYCSLNLTELVLADIRLNYEYQAKPKHSFEIDCGFKFPLSNYTSDFSLRSYFSGYVYWGYNVSLGYSYILNKKISHHINYLSGSILYYNKSRNKYLGVGGEDQTYGYGLGSTNENIFELKLLFKQKIFNNKRKNNNSGSFNEWYTGIGLYNRVYEDISYAYAGGHDPHPSISSIKFNYFQTPEVDRFNKSSIRFCLGFNYGIAWSKK